MFSIGLNVVKFKDPIDHNRTLVRNSVHNKILVCYSALNPMLVCNSAHNLMLVCHNLILTDFRAYLVHPITKTN